MSSTKPMQTVVEGIQQLAWSFLPVSAGNYGAIGLSLIINVILTWRLGAQGFGQLALLLMASQILTFFVSNWTLLALVRFGTQELLQRGTLVETFWARTWIVAPWMAVAAMGLAVWRDPIAAYLGLPYWGIWLVFIHFLFASTLATVGAMFQAVERMKSYALALFMEKAVALTAILLFPSALGPLTVLGCYTVGSLAVSVWAIGSLGPRFFLPIQLPRQPSINMWWFSVPLIASTWIGLFGTRWIDYAIIKRYLTLADLGLYSLAYQIAGVVQQVTIIFSTLLLPHFSRLVARRQEPEIRMFVERALPYGFLCFSGLLGVFILLAKPMIPLVFGPAFAGAVHPLSVMMLATMSLALFNAFTPLLSAFGSTWVLTGVCFLSAVVNVVTDLVLIPPFGISGAATAMIASYGTAALLVLAVVQWRLGSATFRCGLAGLPVLTVFVCSMLLEGLNLYVASGGGLAISTYLVAWRLGLFGKDDAILLTHMRLPGFLKWGLVKVFSGKAG